MVAQKEQELYNYEITKESYLQLETIKDNGFPRLDKLVSEAVRLFNREEEIIDDKNKKGGKAPVKK